MSSQTTTHAPAQKAANYDTKSIASDTSTLTDAKDGKTDDKDSSNDGTKLGPSAADFAKAAKAQGWAAPTATRPSFGG